MIDHVYMVLPFMGESLRWQESLALFRNDNLRNFSWPDEYHDLEKSHGFYMPGEKHTLSSEEQLHEMIEKSLPFLITVNYNNKLPIDLEFAMDANPAYMLLSWDGPSFTKLSKSEQKVLETSITELRIVASTAYAIEYRGDPAGLIPHVFYSTEGALILGNSDDSKEDLEPLHFVYVNSQKGAATPQGAILRAWEPEDTDGFTKHIAEFALKNSTLWDFAKDRDQNHRVN